MDYKEKIKQEERKKTELLSCNTHFKSFYLLVCSSTQMLRNAIKIINSNFNKIAQKQHRTGCRVDLIAEEHNVILACQIF